MGEIICQAGALSCSCFKRGGADIVCPSVVRWLPCSTPSSALCGLFMSWCLWQHFSSHFLNQSPKKLEGHGGESSAEVGEVVCQQRSTIPEKHCLSNTTISFMSTILHDSVRFVLAESVFQWNCHAGLWVVPLCRPSFRSVGDLAGSSLGRRE